MSVMSRSSFRSLFNFFILNLHKVYIIVAVDQNNGIGKAGQIPWRLKGDMQFFKEITTKTVDPTRQNMVVMGRKTWESLPSKFKPLPDRVNLVLTRNPEAEFEHVKQAASLQEVQQLADEKIEKIFIIGGGTIYKQALAELELAGIYLTRVAAKFPCDTFFPEIPEEFSKQTSLGETEEDGLAYEFLLYERQ
jgi:dihydrofolate reductase